MLRVILVSFPDSADKSLRFAQALAKESLQSHQADRDIGLFLYLTVVLLPVEQGGIF